MDKDVLKQQLIERCQRAMDEAMRASSTTARTSPKSGWVMRFWKLSIGSVPEAMTHKMSGAGVRGISLTKTT